MPGAGGMQAANYLASLAPKDGTVMSVLVPNITLAQVLGVQAIAYDTRTFNWIGRIVATTATLFTWHTSGTRTLADLKTRETLIASTGPLSQAEINSTMLNGVVGTKFKLIRGYKGSGEAALAVERGEADGEIIARTNQIVSEPPALDARYAIERHMVGELRLGGGQIRAGRIGGDLPKLDIVRVRVENQDCPAKLHKTFE